MNIERHHVLPVGLRGPNIQENIIDLFDGVHSNLHKECNISSNVPRRHNELANNHIIPNSKVLASEEKMLKMFISGTANLPTWVQDKVLLSLNGTKLWYAKQLLEPMPEDLKFNCDRNITIEEMIDIKRRIIDDLLNFNK